MTAWLLWNMKPGATEKVFSECSPSDRREGGGVKVKTEEEVSRLVVYRQPCLHPKMQPGNQTFPSCAWDLAGGALGAQYAGSKGRRLQCWVPGPRQPLNYIILVRPRGWRSPVETLNVVTRDLGSSPTSHLAATGWELRVSWAGAVGERNQGLCWAELYRDSAPCHCHCHCIQSHDVTW